MRLPTKLLTFESWVSHSDWYGYARSFPQFVPLLLVDRSPCQDPYLDALTVRPADRRIVISGLCRTMKSFKPGDDFIYVTRIDRRLYQQLNLPHVAQTSYFGVASLQVQLVWDSHTQAAAHFSSRRYVADPNDTPYPPNLAHDHRPIACSSREACIVYEGRRAHTPRTSTRSMWLGQYREYYARNRKHSLRVALCGAARVDGREALKLTPETAPILTSRDWGGRAPNINGLWVDDDKAAQIRARIAASGDRDA
jgi:hypothetical protein